MLMIRNGALISLKNLIYLTFIGLICLSPSLKIMPQSIFSTNFHDDKRFIELLLVSFILLYSVFLKNNTLSFNVKQPIHYSIYLLIAFAVTSSYLAFSPRHAFIEVSVFSGLIYLALFVANSYHENDRLLTKQITYIFWASILLCMLSFYVGYIAATVSFTPLMWPAPLTGFTNIRSFNQYQLWTFGLITLPLLNIDFKSKRTRNWLHLALIFWWVLLFFSASRGVLLAWVSGILITAFVYRKLAWLFIRLQLGYITAGFFSYLTLFQAIPYLRGSTIVSGTIMRDSTNDRIELWSQSLYLIQNHPLFGVGPMHFAWNSNSNAHPHNSVLQIMAEWGLPAALLILTVAAYGLFCWLRKFNINSLQTKSKPDINLAIVLFFTLITNTVYSLVDGVIVMPISQVLMFTIIGLMLGYYSKDNMAAIETKSLFRRIFAGITLITLIWSTLPEILQNASSDAKGFSMGYTAAGPRFWLEVK
jgi:O-antigen ligase